LFYCTRVTLGKIDMKDARLPCDLDFG
jgi:hypothetical protein